MVSNRTRYVSESTSDDETVDMDYLPNNQTKPPRKPTRTPKCFSKNALMARENRLKKKMYINSLETQVSALKSDNKKLTHKVDSQSAMIDELKKEVKYLKSVLANSEGIEKLIRAINSSTGMAVSTSLDKNVNRSPIAQKAVPDVEMVKEPSKIVYNKVFDTSRHPWEDPDPLNSYVNYPTPESNASCYGSPEFEELDNDGLLFDINDLPIDMNNEELLEIIDEKQLETPMLPVDEHDYHNTYKDVRIKQEEDDAGVCLHVSKNRVSLEFCSSCSSNATESWNTGS